MDQLLSVVENLITPQNLDKAVKISQLYGWLLSGIVTAGLIWYLNYWKERRHYKNLIAMVAWELDFNYGLLTALLSGSEIVATGFKAENWEKVKYDMARYISPEYFWEIEICYKRIYIWKIKPHTLITEDAVNALNIIDDLLCYMVKVSNVILPDETHIRIQKYKKYNSFSKIVNHFKKKCQNIIPTIKQAISKVLTFFTT